VKRKYFCPEVPFSVLIDKAGTIVYSHLGYKKGDELVMKKKIQALLP
jgi:hypothetical protein